MSANSDTFDPAIQTEEIGFSPDKLVSCSRCGRQNAPNRVECIYCGNGLDIDPANIEKPVFRKLEAWEPGWNLIITGGTGDVAEAAELLSVEKMQLENIIASGVPLPAARLEEKAAAIAGTKLAELGFTTKTLSDDDLVIVKPPVRLGKMEFQQKDLVVTEFNTRRTHTHSWASLSLIVNGFFSSGKIDSIEKRRRKATSTIFETATSADELIFDVYTRDSIIGYRIHLAGFDYACLGEGMTQLATENMSSLIDALRSRSQVKFVEDYKRVRHLLTGIWDVESRTDPKGLQQTGFGKREFGVVRSTNNVEQFTRFSRLQRVML